MSERDLPRPKPPVFLERQGYRRRRMMDAARVLPFFGLVLWLIPLLWEETGFGVVRSSSAIIYLFGVWALLVIGAALIATALRGSDSDPGAAPTPNAAPEPDPAPASGPPQEAPPGRISAP